MMDWEELFKIYVTGKWLISCVFKELPQIDKYLKNGQKMWKGI